MIAKVKAFFKQVFNEYVEFYGQYPCDFVE